MPTMPTLQGIASHIHSILFFMPQTLALLPSMLISSGLYLLLMAIFNVLVVTSDIGYKVWIIQINWAGGHCAKITPCLCIERNHTGQTLFMTSIVKLQFTVVHCPKRVVQVAPRSSLGPRSSCT